MEAAYYPRSKKGGAMKATVVFFGAVAVLATIASASQRPLAAGASTSSSLVRLPRTTRAGEQTSWGHIKSITRKAGSWEMKFDPALLLFGSAAEQASFEDTGSRDVPNDSYVVEEGHRLYTYVVPSTAPVTILTAGLKTTEITVSEFAQILQGRNPKRRPLFGRPKDFGFWIRVGTKYPNPILSLDEQYHP
jgi:hypothetical protein